MLHLGSTIARLKLKGIDGSSYKRWSAMCKLMTLVKPYQLSSLNWSNFSLSITFGKQWIIFVGDAIHMIYASQYTEVYYVQVRCCMAVFSSCREA